LTKLKVEFTIFVLIKMNFGFDYGKTRI